MRFNAVFFVMCMDLALPQYHRCYMFFSNDNHFFRDYSISLF